MSSFEGTKSFLASRPLATLTAASKAPFTVAKWNSVADAVNVSAPSHARQIRARRGCCAPGLHRTCRPLRAARACAIASGV